MVGVAGWFDLPDADPRLQAGATKSVHQVVASLVQRFSGLRWDGDVKLQPRGAVGALPLRIQRNPVVPTGCHCSEHAEPDPRKLPGAASPYAAGDQLGTTPPVSYTHLDVYKRQRLARVNGFAQLPVVTVRAREAEHAARQLRKRCLLYTSRCV